PVGLSGDRARATSPEAMNDQPRSSPSTSVGTGRSSWFDARTSAIPTAPTASAAPQYASQSPPGILKTPTRSPRSWVSKEERHEGGAGELRLRHEPDRARLLDERAEVGRVPARGQDHRRRAAVRPRQPARDLEAVEVRQLHVEEDDVGSKLSYGLDRRLAVSRLADDVELPGLEAHPCRRAKAGVVVDDQDARHVRILAYGSPNGHTVNHTPC